MSKKDEPTESFELETVVDKKKIETEKSKKRLVRPKVMLALVFVLVFLSFFDEDKPASTYEALHRQLTIQKVSLEDNQKKISPSESERLYRDGLKSFFLFHRPGFVQGTKFFLASSQYKTHFTESLAMLLASYSELRSSLYLDPKGIERLDEYYQFLAKKDVLTIEHLFGVFYYQLRFGSLVRAEELLRRYVSRKKQTEGDLYYLYAELLNEKKEPQAALAVLNKIENLVRNNPRAAYQKLKSLLLLQKVQEAQSFLESSKFKTHPRFLFLLFQSKPELKMAKKIEELKSYLDEKELAEFHYVTAKKLASSGAQDELVEHYIQRAIRAYPNEMEYQLFYYQYLYDQGKTLKKDQKQARHNYFLAQSYQALQKASWKEAGDYALQAIQQIPQSSRAKENLVDALVGQQDFKNAVRVSKEIYQEKTSLQNAERVIKLLLRSYRIEEAKKFLSAEPERLSKFNAWVSFFENKDQKSYEEFQSFRNERFSQEDYFLYAQVLFRLKKYSQALAVTQLAQSTFPEDTRFQVLELKVLAETESLAQAIQYSKVKLIQRGAFSFPLVEQRVEMILDSGNFSLAEQEVQESIKNYPQEESLHALKAKVLFRNLKNRKENKNLILSEMRKYLVERPYDLQALLQLFEIYREYQDFEESLAVLDQLEAVYDHYPGLYYLRGMTYLKLSRTEKALESFLEELKRNPSFKQNRIELGRLLAENGKPKEAVQVLKPVEEQYPKDPEALEWLGVSYYKEKNYYASIEALKRAIDVNPGSAILYKRIAASYEAISKIGDAKQALRKYIQLFPNAPDRRQIESQIQK